MKTLFFVLILTFCLGYGGLGQVNISAGGSITENFTFGESATATLTSSWRADKNTTVRTVGSYAAAGSATEQRAGNNMSATATNGIYNFGAGDATTAIDRAVGGLSSGAASKSVNIYLHLYNTGAIPIPNFTISYAVEKYREGTNAAGYSIQLYHSADGNTWSSAGSDFLTSFPGADPTNSGYPSAPGDTGYVTAKTLPVALAAGSSLYLAWNYSVTSGSTTTSAQAMGIDDVSIMANGGTASGTYTWNQTGTADWTTSTNWTPSRTTPQVNDILQFTNGAACSITHVPAQTIGQLIISNNTTVNLQSDAAVALTIGGEAGADLVVPAGCSLNLNGTHALSIVVGTGANGTISGHLAFSPTAETAHRLTAADPGALTFNYGATFTAGNLSSGSPFGTVSVGSVIFTNGATFIHQAGNDPFGASQPNSVVVFQTGSLYKAIAAVPLSFSGRSYANVELASPTTTFSPDGAFPVSMDNLTVTSGILNFNMTGTPGHSVKGNIYVAAGAILNFAPAQAGTVIFNGTCPQAFSGSGTIAGTTNSTIEIANSDGITLHTNLTTDGHLKLTNGFLTLGSNDLLLGTSSTILGTPSSSAMIVATGTGQVKKQFLAPGYFTYPIGDHTATAEYSPVTLTFSSGNFAAGNYAGVNLVNAKYPADPNTMNYLNRYWALTANSISSFSCDALFQYVPADVTGTEGQIYCVRVDTVPFITYNVSDTVLHQLTANGLTSFGIITGTNAALLVYEVSGSGSYCQGSAGLPVTLSGSQLNVNYQLKKNGINLGSPVPGTGSPITWTNQLAGTYTVEGISGSGNNMMNGQAIIEETTPGAVGVSIAASANPVCPNTPVTFAATPVNGGSSPSYQWKVNGVNVGANTRTYAYTLTNNDAVTCVMTSSLGCTQGNPAASNTVTMIVNETMPVSVSVAASANPVSEGTSVTFTASALNGGTNPTYQWKVNDVNVGTNSPVYTYIAANYDQVVCVLTSNLLCVTCNPAISNTTIMTVNASGPNKPSFVVYPNPTTGMFTLEQKGGVECVRGRVELTGIQGERLMTAELTGERKFVFSLSDVPAGLYLLRIFAGGTIETIKINKH
jgi:hypothetical protein